MATAFSLRRFARSNPLDRVRAVEKGLPARALRQLAADPAITMADLAQAIGTRRTLDRRLKEDSRLSLEEGDRLDSFIQVLDLAAHIFGNRAKAMAWLRAPKHRFDGRTPLEMMRTGTGARAIEELLIASQHGIMA